MKLLLVGMGLVFSSPPLSAQNHQCANFFSFQTQPLKDRDFVQLAEQTYSLLASYASVILKVHPKEIIKNQEMNPDFFYDLSEKPTLPQETLLLKKMAELVDKNQLDQFVTQWVEYISKKSEENELLSSIRKLSEQQKVYVITHLAATIKATVDMRGLTKSSKQQPYLEWSELSKRISEKIDSSPKGLHHLLHFAQTRWTKTKKVELLVDGKASFAKREELIDKAQQSIDVLTWAIYDDMTGFQTVDRLIQKHKSGIKVRVILDGQISQMSGYRDAVKKLEDNGVQVIRWFNKSSPFLGQHRKMIVVDGKAVVAGGLNFGDVYSHKNPNPQVAKWRDTDIFFEGGQATAVAVNLFNRLWNEQINSGATNFEKINMSVEDTVAEQRFEEDVRIAIIDHSPSRDTVGSTVLLTLLKGIREAESSVDIENAYIVTFPALKNEIQKAVKRGVTVRVLTNSSVSVDEPIISVPILRAVKNLARIGTNVFLKKGSTLHSKMVIIDGRYTFVMSYNLHPRSERIEGEMAVVVDSKKFAFKAQQVFENDINSQKADRVVQASDIQLPNSGLALIILRIFYDML